MAKRRRESGEGGSSGIFWNPADDAAPQKSFRRRVKKKAGRRGATISAWQTSLSNLHLRAAVQRRNFTP